MDGITEAGEIMILLEAVRQEKKLSFAELAKRSKFSKQQIGRWFKCYNYPTLANFLDLLHAMDADISIVFGGNK